MYAIRIIRQFYGPRTEKGYVVDGFAGERRAEFRTRAEAEATARMLDHNEAGRSEYKVVRVK